MLRRAVMTTLLLAACRGRELPAPEVLASPETASAPPVDAAVEPDAAAPAVEADVPVLAADPDALAGVPGTAAAHPKGLLAAGPLEAPQPRALPLEAPGDPRGTFAEQVIAASDSPCDRVARRCEAYHRDPRATVTGGEALARRFQLEAGCQMGFEAIINAQLERRRFERLGVELPASLHDQLATVRDSVCTAALQVMGEP
jgi:hypothetical protein